MYFLFGLTSADRGGHSFDQHQWRCWESCTRCMVLNVLFIYIHILYTAQRLRVVEIHVKRNIVGSTLCFHFRNVNDNFIFIIHLVVRLEISQASEQTASRRITCGTINFCFYFVYQCIHFYIWSVILREILFKKWCTFL